MKNDEETRIEKLEQLIQSKAFHELSADERDLVLAEFETEAQYTAMQTLSPELEMAFAEDTLQPRPSALDFLKEHLSTRSFSLLSGKWYELKMPAYAAALVVIVACAVTWWATRQPVDQISIKPATKVDTVYLTSKADTIFKEKVVYRFVKKPVEAKLVVDQKTEVSQKKEAPASVSMKDKEELERLLVSGSR